MLDKAFLSLVVDNHRLLMNEPSFIAELRWGQLSRSLEVCTIFFVIKKLDPLLRLEHGVLLICFEVVVVQKVVRFSEPSLLDDGPSLQLVAETQIVLNEVR